MGLFNFREKKLSIEELSAVLRKNLEKVAFRELALHIAISYIANTLSKCEFKVYESGKEVKNRLYYLLNINPNPNENSSQFINHFIENYYYGDDGALLVKQGDHLYCADDFDVDDADPLKPFEYTNVRFGQSALKRKLRAGDVFHLKLDNKNIKQLVDAVGVEYGQVMDLALQSFKRTNGKKYKLLLEQYKAGDPQFAQIFETVIKKQLQSFLENDGPAVYPQFKGMDLQEFSTAASQNSDDIVNIRKEMFEVTAQAFKIPLSMMLGNITNMNEIVKVYLSICIDPLADMISEELTRKCYTEQEWLDGCFVKVDTSCINHVDMLEVADKVDKLISCGAYNIDEVRHRLDSPLLDTDFSKTHFITKNYEPLDMVMSGQRGGDKDEKNLLLDGD